MIKSKFKKNKINLKKIGFFRFEKLGDFYLLTNDFGFYAILKPNQFRDFLEEKLKKGEAIYKDLRAKGFLKDISPWEKERLIKIYRAKNSNLFNPGPSLHIVVITLRCNFRCIYCQVNSRTLKEKGYDMSLDTAKKTVDFIFSAPNPNIVIEFQGGEPLVNWPMVKFTVEYAREKAKETGKNLRFALVSNLALMTEKKLEFLLKNEVGLCTSLDGPKELQNHNRPYPGHDGYKITFYWFKKIRERKKERSALATISRESLKYPKQIIDEYLKWGLRTIHLRPVIHLGRSKNRQMSIGYSAEEFIKFWQKSMDYIIRLNKEGVSFEEREAKIMLQKILTDRNPGYTDLESPCGAVLGQLLYNYDGKIYTCDEGRMVGDDTFSMGNVENNYEEIILNSKTKTMIAASCLENTSCDQCVYKPYCGICPVKNYVYYGTLFPQINTTDHCKVKKAQFNYLFSKLQEKETREIFEKWVLQA